MVRFVYCEWLKLKRSRIVLFSVVSVCATPFMLFVEALQTHFEHPEQLFTLADIYSNGLLYEMLLINMMVYVAITAYLFSREYTERTLKTILPSPVSRSSFLTSKFLIQLIWITILMLITWTGILLLSGLYHLMIGLEGFHISVAFTWLIKMLLGGILMFITLSPFAYLSLKSKGIVVPILFSAVIVMGSAALANQDLGALYPWTGTYFLMMGKTLSTIYPIWLSSIIIILIAMIGFISTYTYFKKEDLK